MPAVLLSLTVPQSVALIGLILLLFSIILGEDTGVETVFIGSILIFSGLIGSLLTNIPLMLITATILGVFYIGYGRTWVRSKIKTNSHVTNADRLLLQTGIVVKEITPTQAGRIKIDDEIWRAVSNTTLTPNTRVKIISLSGTTLTVAKI